MARLDIKRQEILEPKRIQHAVKKIEGLGYEITVRYSSSTKDIGLLFFLTVVGQQVSP